MAPNALDEAYLEYVSVLAKVGPTSMASAGDSSLNACFKSVLSAYEIVYVENDVKTFSPTQSTLLANFCDDRQRLCKKISHPLPVYISFVCVCGVFFCLFCVIKKSAYPPPGASEESVIKTPREVDFDVVLFECE